MLHHPDSGQNPSRRIETQRPVSGAVLPYNVRHELIRRRISELAPGVWRFVNSSSVFVRERYGDVYVDASDFVPTVSSYSLAEIKYMPAIMKSVRILGSSTVLEYYLLDIRHVQKMTTLYIDRRVDEATDNLAFRERCERHDTTPVSGILYADLNGDSSYTGDPTYEPEALELGIQVSEVTPPATPKS